MVRPFLLTPLIRTQADPSVPDGSLQLPIAAPRDPAHNLHLDIRALRVPRHHRPQQGQLLCVAVLEGRPRRRAPQSVRQHCVRRHGCKYARLKMGEWQGEESDMMREGLRCDSSADESRL
jgi:hypothetical protein